MSFDSFIHSVWTQSFIYDCIFGFKLIFFCLYQMYSKEQPLSWLFLTIQREGQKPTKSKSTTTTTFDFSCLLTKMRMTWQRTNSSIHPHCWQERQWFHSFFADAATSLTIWEEPRTMFVGSTRQQGATDYDEEVKSIFVFFFFNFFSQILWLPRFSYLKGKVNG